MGFLDSVPVSLFQIKYLLKVLPGANMIMQGTNRTFWKASWSHNKSPDEHLERKAMPFKPSLILQHPSSTCYSWNNSTFQIKDLSMINETGGKKVCCLKFCILHPSSNLVNISSCQSLFCSRPFFEGSAWKAEWGGRSGIIRYTSHEWLLNGRVQLQVSPFCEGELWVTSHHLLHRASPIKSIREDWLPHSFLCPVLSHYREEKRPHKRKLMAGGLRKNASCVV